MKVFSKAVLVGVMAVSIFASLNSFAGDPIRKLGRGICNAGAGVLEVPIQIYDTNQQEGGLAAVTYGSLKGISLFVAREVIGVVEIATFLVPLPECTDDPRDTGWGYGPIMRPEWIVDPSHNWYSIVYQDSPGLNGTR